MSKSLISYRVNLFACLFNVLVLAYVVYGGAFPWVQLAAIALNGAVAVGCKMSHNKQLSAAAVRDQQALEAKANEAIMCSQWEIRNTEAKMVDAGIIAPVEMTVCENEECQNCAPTRRAISEKNNRDRIRLGAQASANSLPIRKRQHQGYRQYEYDFQKWVREYAKTAVGGTPMPADGTKPVTVTYTCKTCSMLSTKPTCGPCTAAQAEEKTGGAAPIQPRTPRYNKGYM